MSRKGMGVAAFLFLMLLTGITRVPAQTDWFRTSGRSQNDNAGLGNLFLYETFSFPSEETRDTRLISYVKVAYDMLQFVRQDSVF